MTAFRPRVLVVPPSYFASNRVHGGGERYALEYARALAELTPTTLGLFDVTAAREVQGPLEIRTFEVSRATDTLLFPATRKTWSEVGRYDIIHSMMFPSPLTDFLLLSAELRGQRVVLTDVGGGLPCVSTYLTKIHRRLDPNRRADGLALLSEYASTLFDGWKQPKTVLYGGVNLNPFEGGRATGTGYALFVGRLLPHKGVRELIEALGPHTPLRVIGRPLDGGYLEQLRDAAAGKDVTFLLDVDDVELGRQYAGAAVVIQPSLPLRAGGETTAELLGLVALEGMAHGKPVIVTRTASLPELVVDGVTGFVVDAYDPAALRASVELLIRQPEKSRSMGAAAQAHVQERFTWNRVAERGMDFYRRLRPALRHA